MKVFISSVISGFEEYREAAAQAVRSLGHQVIRAEDFGALPDTPQQVCLAGVRQADVVALLLGARYGAPQASGLSPTHEEYREARERLPVLVYVQQDVEREPAQQAFLDEVQAWDSGKYRVGFATPEQLRDALTRDLKDFEVGLARGSADETEMLDRARQLVPEGGRGWAAPAPAVIIAGGPRQQILRPSEIEVPQLATELKKDALYGSAPVFDDRHGTEVAIEGHALLVRQPNASVVLDELGSIRVVQPAREDDRGRETGITSLIDEDIRDRLERAIRFAGTVLERIDRPHRLTDVVVVAALLDAGHMPWRTRAEHAASPNSATMGFGREDIISVELAPPRRKRASLSQEAARIAQDLAVLLRREVRR